MWIKHLIKAENDNSDDYDDKYLKIKINSNDKLKMYKLVILVRKIFIDDNKYCPQVFLEECLYKY